MSGVDKNVKYLQELLVWLQRYEEAEMDGVDGLSKAELKKYVGLAEASVLRVLVEHAYANSELKATDDSSIH